MGLQGQWKLKNDILFHFWSPLNTCPFELKTTTKQLEQKKTIKQPESFNCN